MGCNHFANLLSHRSVKDSFNRKLKTIALALKRGTVIGDEQRRVRGTESLRSETKEGTKRRFHLVNLLSIKDVKEGFDRKPTTIELT